METNFRSYLLDTQVLLWLLTGDKRLDEKEFKERFDLESSILVTNQTSLWEIQIKYDLKKLPLEKRPGSWLKEAIVKTGLSYTSISDDAIFSLGKLPPIHRDPFDRLLIAHALVNRWTLITSDQILEGYPVEVAII